MKLFFRAFELQSAFDFIMRDDADFYGWEMVQVVAEPPHDNIISLQEVRQDIGVNEALIHSILLAVFAFLLLCRFLVRSLKVASSKSFHEPAKERMSFLEELLFSNLSMNCKTSFSLFREILSN